jgi:hypothetical protein
MWMTNQLGYMTEKYNRLYIDQIGKRRQHSATYAAMAATHEIEQAKQAKKITTALFMDVSGAFDNVSNDYHFQALQHLGYTTAIEFWVERF